MELLTWIGNSIGIIIKIIITTVLFIPFIKTWKACEDEIKSLTNSLKLQQNSLSDNINKANEYYEKYCKTDLKGIFDLTLLETSIKSYNLSVKEYQERFIDILNKQNENIIQSQNMVFELRKNEWKSIFPFVSAIALMWLGIKF